MSEQLPSPQYASMIARHQWLPYGDNKFPINPNTGMNASLLHPGTYEWARHPSQFSRGVGYVFHEDDPRVGLDFDLYKAKSPIPQKAVDYLNTLTLGEVGPSYPTKASYHFYSTANAETRARIRNGVTLFGCIDIMNARSFMRVTFRPTNCLPIADISTFLNELLDLANSRLPSSTVEAGTHPETDPPSRHPDLVVATQADWKRVNGMCCQQNGRFDDRVMSTNSPQWAKELLLMCAILARAGLDRRQAYDFLRQTIFVQGSPPSPMRPNETRQERLHRVFYPPTNQHADVWRDALRSNAKRDAFNAEWARQQVSAGSVPAALVPPMSKRQQRELVQQALDEMRRQGYKPK